MPAPTVAYVGCKLGRKGGPKDCWGVKQTLCMVGDMVFMCTPCWCSCLLPAGWLVAVWGLMIQSRMLSRRNWVCMLPGVATVGAG